MLKYDKINSLLLMLVIKIVWIYPFFSGGGGGGYPVMGLAQFVLFCFILLFLFSLFNFVLVR